jgi:plastocyanin
MFIPFIGLVLASTVSAKVIDIQVGGDGGALVFVPEAVFADAGDQVVYHFNPKNHTVTQSSFAGPCTPKEGGVKSGFRPVGVDVAVADRPTFTIHVNDTQPIWVFCGQASNTPNSHCGAGMVSAVNCGPDGAPNSFTNFKKSALDIGAKLKADAQHPPTSTWTPDYGTTAIPPPTSTWTADYGTTTIPPPPSPSLVTDTVTLGNDVWTTTYSSYPNSPAPTPVSPSGNTIEVIVGGPNGNLTFTPSRVSAAPRDTIKFTFQVKNHTVTQSSFSAPCMPLTDKTNGTRIGFDSGYFPVAANATTFPTWSLTINDTAPMWAYCAQANHCGGGMVFAINSDETSGRNFAAFQSLAKTLNGTTSSNSTNPTNGNTGTENGAMSNSVGGGLIVAFVAALVGSLL